ncbi:hypothetical protein [Phreatobacter stygius]|uniref:Uncharacterized protein n=1 Tax=Phreatobacter stygius TaxID=1940610 RepID=A0A4D7AX59_9HYPH|nr:hypothetical protein [Phreatobacter stygius]QCI63513.1 hypothetical protein E8M01_04235 [Phreatobacter stygius]
MRQLACRGQPAFASAVLYLGRRSVIGIDRKEGYDSITCWRTTRPTSIRGLPVHAVCGYDNDQLTQLLHPQLFSRARGTAPPSTFAIVTSAPAATAQAWATQNLGEPAPRSRWIVEASPLYSGYSELRCATSGAD